MERHPVNLKDIALEEVFLCAQTKVEVFSLRSVSQRLAIQHLKCLRMIPRELLKC